MTDAESFHFDHFVEFCSRERATGGPDPHMSAVVLMGSRENELNRAWWTHLYAGVYNVPTAEALFDCFTAEQSLTTTEAEWMAFLDRHWKGVSLRRERRCVNTPKKMTEFMLGFGKIAALIERGRLAQVQDFEELWAIASGLPRVGRYAATKITELWHRFGLVTIECPDIRAHGGWSPRSALRLIYGDENFLLLDPKDNSSAAVKDAEAAAAALYPRVRAAAPNLHNLTMFELEVMLCEYKASYSTKRQYPGRSLDSELKYERAVRPYWYPNEPPGQSRHSAARLTLSPRWALGEQVGWSGPRDDLGTVLSAHGYTWSDGLYDYLSSVDRLADPVRWPEPLFARPEEVA